MKAVTVSRQRQDKKIQTDNDKNFMNSNTYSTDLKRLTSELVNEKLLKRIIYFDEIKSTSTYAKENKTGEDTLIYTPNQSCGRGRYSRSWISIPGKDLTFSIVKNFVMKTDETHIVNFYASYILMETLKYIFRGSEKINFSLKWPNDVLLNGKKTAGILSEVSGVTSGIKKIIIGVGVNVNSDDFPDEINLKSTSLYKESKQEINPEEILTRFILNFYQEENLVYQKDRLLKLWAENFQLKGQGIFFRKTDDEKADTAIIEGIGDDGELKLKLGNGEIRKYYSGEIIVKTI